MAQPKATLERLSAFSDGVFSVVITIMVLELRPPEHPSLAALLPLWPIGLSYVVSYIFIAIVWVNHHHVLQYADVPTAGLIWKNFAHLFSVSLVPFSTAWIARTQLAGEPVSLHAGIFVFVNVTYVALLRETLEQAEEVEISARALRMMRMRSYLTLGAFSTAMLLSLKFPLWGLGLVCCCLVLCLRPEAPREIGEGTSAFAVLKASWRRSARPEKHKCVALMSLVLVTKLFGLPR
jgi:uncharacterized membrane protein